MRTRTTAAAVILTTALLLTGCSGSGNDPAPKTTTPGTPAPATYDAASWKARVAGLVSQLDQAQPDCESAPSSQVCADALNTADQTILDMQQDLKASGESAGHPATADQLGKIHDGYTQYTTGNCAGYPQADKFGSECRVATATVMLGVATLPAKMTQDGD